MKSEFISEQSRIRLFFKLIWFIHGTQEVLVRKANDWGSMHGFGSCIKKPERDLMGKIDGPGIYIFKHRDKKCFQFVGRTENIFASCSDCLKASFEGSTSEPLAALFITSLSSSWDFYFIPVEVQGQVHFQFIKFNPQEQEQSIFINLTPPPGGGDSP